MKATTAKTARFSEVVKACGVPAAVSLWVRPEDDKPFVAAVREERVMTIQQGGRTTDYGVVGFFQEGPAAYLVFPKSLEAFKDRRVVGVKYDLVQSSAPVGKLEESEPPSVSRVPGKKRLPVPTRLPGLFVQEVPERPLPRSATAVVRRPVEKLFAVTIRFTAATEVTLKVAAESKKTAEEVALKRVGTPGFSQATITRKVSSASLRKRDSD